MPFVILLTDDIVMARCIWYPDGRHGLIRYVPEMFHINIDVSKSTPPKTTMQCTKERHGVP